MFCKIKIYLMIFIMGLIAGIVGMYYLQKEKPATGSKIKITQISGEKITHSNYKLKGNSISFETESEGSGKIKTKILKELIPEANDWLNKNHCIQANYLFQYHANLFYSSYSLSYYRRFSQFAIGGGILASKQSIGLNFGAQIWF